MLRFIKCKTNFMHLSPFWESAICAATQELPRILWNMQVHYRVRKSLPLVLILSHIDAVHNIPSSLSLRSILILSREFYGFWIQLNKTEQTRQNCFCLPCSKRRIFNELRRGADKSLALPISYFHICSKTKIIFFGWVKEVRTTKS
jgi:hypothetical protein